MNPTICKRCGGPALICECAELRREGMMMAADACDEEFTRWGDTHDLGAVQTAAHIAAHIRSLARKPGAPD